MRLILTSAWFLAGNGSIDEFFKAYEWSDIDPSSLIVQAVTRPDPNSRVAIVNRLLDDGADASVVEGRDRVNSLHVLFGHWEDELDFELEADTLARLLDNGADINQHSPRFGYPMEALRMVAATDEDLAPFYDVIFSRDLLDLDVVINAHRGSTLRDLLFGLPEGKSDLSRRAREYDRKH